MGRYSEELGSEVINAVISGFFRFGCPCFTQALYSQVLRIALKKSFLANDFWSVTVCPRRVAM